MRKKRADAHHTATVALCSGVRMRSRKKGAGPHAPHIHVFSLLTASSLSPPIHTDPTADASVSRSSPPSANLAPTPPFPAAATSSWSPRQDRRGQGSGKAQEQGEDDGSGGGAPNPNAPPHPEALVLRRLRLRSLQGEIFALHNLDWRYRA